MAERYPATVAESGRMNLPAAVRRSLGMKPGDKLVFVEKEGGGFEVTTVSRSLDQARALFRQYVPEGSSLVDELIADRKEEARREEADAKAAADRSDAGS